MSVRKNLHSLVEKLPESELEAAQRLLVPLAQEVADPLERLLQEAPDDDEPVTPEDARRLAAARASFRRGETISAEEIKRELLD